MDPELARIRREKWKKQKEQQEKICTIDCTISRTRTAGVEIIDVDVDTDTDKEDEDEENDYGWKTSAIDSATNNTSAAEIIDVDLDEGDDDGWETVAKKPKRRLNTTVTASKAGPASTLRTDAKFMVILVGLPGSGKSHFAKALAMRNKKYIRISQDVLKTRIKCESLCRQTLQDGNIPIIDRCNFDSTQRLHFINIANEFNIPVDCIVFRYSAQTCITRCEERTNHETVDRQNARGVVMGMNRSFCPPGSASASSDREKHDVAAYRVVREVTQFRDANNMVSEYLN